MQTYRIFAALVILGLSTGCAVAADGTPESTASTTQADALCGDPATMLAVCKETTIGPWGSAYLDTCPNDKGPHVNEVTGLHNFDGCMVAPWREMNAPDCDATQTCKTVYCCP